MLLHAAESLARVWLNELERNLPLRLRGKIVTMNALPDCGRDIVVDGLEEGT